MGLHEQGQAARKIRRILDALSLPDASAVVFEFYRTRFVALTGAERAQRFRDGKRNAPVTDSVTPPVTPNVTPPVTASVTASVAPSVTRRVSASGSSSFLKFYSEQFERAFNDTPSINYAKDGAISKRLLKQYGEEKLRGLLEDFFKSEDEFIQKSGHTLGVFASVLNKLLVAKRNGHHGQPRSFSERLWDEAQAEKRGKP